MKNVEMMKLGDHFWATVDDQPMRMEFVALDADGEPYALDITNCILHRIYSYQIQPSWEAARTEAISYAQSIRDLRQRDLDEITARIATLIAAEPPEEDEDDGDGEQDHGEPVAATPVCDIAGVTLPEF